MVSLIFFAVGDIYKGCTYDWARIVEDATGIAEFSVQTSPGVSLPQCFWLSVETPPEYTTTTTTAAPSTTTTVTTTTAPATTIKAGGGGEGRSRAAVRVFPFSI